MSSHPVAKIPYTALLGQILLRHRERLKLHQSDLANALNISQPAYSRIEQGGTSITVSQLRIIGRRLGIAPSYLLNEADQWTQKLQVQGAEVTDQKEVPQGALLVALGLLAALWAVSQ